MITILKRNENNKPMLSIGGYNDFKIITEEQFEKIQSIINSGESSEATDEYIVRTYLRAKKSYPAYAIGEYIIYIDRGDYVLGVINKKSEAVENCYYVDFNNGTYKWIEAEYLHKIANEEDYVILV